MATECDPLQGDSTTRLLRTVVADAKMSLFSFPMFGASAGLVIAVIGYLYQRRKYAKSIIRQLGLESFTTYLSRGLGYRLARYLRPRAAARLSLRTFAINRLDASENTVHVPAAVPKILSLDKMFVPLTALSTEQARVSATQVAFGAYHRILLVGDPGSGKSTLVKRIYRDICRDAIANGNHGRIPVLIELKNLDRYLGSHGAPEGDLVDVVRKQVTSVNTYAGDDLYESFLGNGRLTVLLDGLDEVRTSDFDAVAEKIVQLCDHLARKHGRNQVIVTTRRQLYVNLSTEFTSEFDAHLTLEPFTPDDMYEFLQKWPYERQPEQQLARIFGNLSSQPNIRSMCQTPLILAMYVATDQLTGGEGLPETRPDFYRAVTDELLVRRRSRQHGLTTGLNVLRRTRQTLLGRLALEHLLDGEQPRNTLRWDAALKIVEEEEGLSGDDAGRRIRELSRDTGLFTEERPEESLRFIHLTFCEFLAAQAIVQGAGEAWDTIVDRVERGTGGIGSMRWVERLSEVIIFAIALERNELTRRDRVRWAVRSSSLELALRAVLDSQPYDDPLVLGQLNSIADEVADKNPDGRGENWLHIFRLVAMILRDRELVEESVTGTKPALLAPFFVRIAEEHAAGFGQLFLSYLRLDPSGALELARSMQFETSAEYSRLLTRALDEPAVLTHALARFATNESGARTWAPILALGALHHGSVSKRLLAMSAQVGTVEQRVNRGGRRNWQRCWVTRGTALGTILEAGCRWPGSSAVLAGLSTVPTRTSRLTDRIANLKFRHWLFAAAFFLVCSVTLHPAFTWPVALLGGVSSSTIIVVAMTLNRRHRPWTRSLLMSNFPYLTDAPLPDAVAAVKENPSIGTLQARRIYWHQQRTVGRKITGWTRIERGLPATLGWSPNERLDLIAYVNAHLLPQEVGDREPGDESLSLSA